MRSLGYKDTIRLPHTSFSMKGRLIAKEPEMLLEWERSGLEKRIRDARRGAPEFVLHDGPPYANGHVHIGTALNKVLKDFIVKSRTMMGYDSPYVPGWDCHGMPIEHRVTRSEEHGALDRESVRAECRRYADRFFRVQRDEFRRLGVFGDWDDPYLTMDYSYEAGIVRAFGELVRKGYVYEGLRPIHWCTSCMTALADAEVEYGPHVSPSIYVAFRTREPSEWEKRGLRGDVEIAIWTTTPWTLPANMAVALNPGELYCVVDLEDGRSVLVARRRVEAFLEDSGLTGRVIEGETPLYGRDLEGLLLEHPLFSDRDSLVILADHVTMDDGTGCVHTAPGHGAEDFWVGRQYELETFCPVDAEGTFTGEAGAYAGSGVFEANDTITDDLRENGRLLASRRVEHSYPHCWRCQSPLIFRATRQFFLGLDHSDLRERVLRMVDEIRWHPSWGRERMRNMMAVRPDWCLSRQRSWGVALPVLKCEECGSAVMIPEVIDRVADLIAEKGSDIWFRLEPGEILGLAGLEPECPECGSASLRRVDDILDVWFDSSLSHLNVLGNERFGLSRPCSVYLEATDQHRGWFGVSLITSEALELGRPADNIITHGLVQDLSGKKMSKSLGNVVSPLEIVEKLGADILRLWFAGVDYTADMRADASGLDDPQEAYRKLRNTLRFMLGNLPEQHSGDLDPSTLTGLDRYIYLRYLLVHDQCMKGYRDFQFHRVFRQLRNFATTDLSGLYLDVRKDRLYCDRPGSRARTASVMVLELVCKGLVKLLAPILPFTAEEAWQALPDGARDADSVHLALLEDLAPTDRELEELGRWDEVLEIRRSVMKRLEEMRAEGSIGSGLEAAVSLTVPEALAPDAFGESWDDLLIVSSVELSVGPDSAGDSTATVVKARGRRCERCWKHLEEVGSSSVADDVCLRCATVLEEMGWDGSGD